MSLDKITTLIELLEFRADSTPQNTAFTFKDQSFTYQHLWEKINLFAEQLRVQGVQRGERVILVFPNGQEFFYAFYGAQRIGAIPVPIAPVAGAERILGIAQLAKSKLVIVPSDTTAGMVESFKSQAEGYGIDLFKANLEGAPSEGIEFEPVLPDDIAFIQYTSGSTGLPKGVMISHDNLLTNVRQMIAGMEITTDDVFVSWLPTYHDMGLILMTMAPFYLGTLVHLLPTSLKNLKPWLEAIQAHRGTFTAAPDFAYRLLFRHIQTPEDYDLSSLRVALNAAEHVRAETVNRFHESFQLENVMVAGYGLAEVTVGVSMWPPGTKEKVDPKGYVSVGPPFPDVEIKIVKDGGESLPPDEVGEIAIKSVANSRGYFDQPEATSELDWDEGYILSGDLGYLDGEGSLFIVGRKKNIIKYIGRTVAPKEIEEAVDSIEAVRYSAAIGVDKGRIEGEQTYVFAEIRDGEARSEDELHEVVIVIVNRVHDRMGFRPARVYLLKPKSIPQTHNGKIQHQKLKEKYLDRSLFTEGRILYPHY
ncbi:AMP-binding protein [Chloroflexota bacterium]